MNKCVEEINKNDISRWTKRKHNIFHIQIECFVRARTGNRLHRQVVVMTLNAPSLYDCESVCANERKFMCNILSYRYVQFSTCQKLIKYRIESMLFLVLISLFIIDVAQGPHLSGKNLWKVEIQYSLFDCHINYY